MPSKNRPKCPRCHGPATMIDKAPSGESGDVVRCAAEETCAALGDAAKDLERAHLAVVDAAAEFVRIVGTPKRDPVEIKIAGCTYMDLVDAVQDWRAAGEALVKATRAHAAAEFRAA